MEYEKLSDERQGEPSNLFWGTGTIRARVEAARGRQRQRFEGTGLVSYAAASAATEFGPAEVLDHCQMDDACA